MITVMLSIPADHPVFAGHFPGQPVVPGVMLLDLVYLAILNAIDIAPIGLSIGKFHCPVEPGTTLHLQFEVEERSARFSLHNGEHKVADGKFLLPEQVL